MGVYPKMHNQKGIYSIEERSRVLDFYVPKHVAIIMDGNRRWAKQRGVSAMVGHWEGAEVLGEIVRAAAELGIGTLTVYAFSTENWSRSSEEVEDLMNLFELYLENKKEEMIRDGVKLNAIGDLSRLPIRVLDALEETKKATEKGSRINLVLALNYGARDEIRRAFIKMVEEKIPPGQITEEKIGHFLDTHGYPDPDLLIRTSGEMRLSNFLLWQISYAEFFSTEVLWPDFSPKELLESIVRYQERTRRLGG